MSLRYSHQPKRAATLRNHRPTEGTGCNVTTANYIAVTLTGAEFGNSKMRFFLAYGT